MAHQLEFFSNVEVRRTVHFLQVKYFTLLRFIVKYRVWATVYGPHAMSCPSIVKWCQMFEDGRTDFTDAEREGSTATVSTPDMVHRVEDVIRSNCKVRKTQIASSENS